MHTQVMGAKMEQRKSQLLKIIKTVGKTIARKLFGELLTKHIKPSRKSLIIKRESHVKYKQSRMKLATVQGALVELFVSFNKHISVMSMSHNLIWPRVVQIKWKIATITTFLSADLIHAINLISTVRSK